MSSLLRRRVNVLLLVFILRVFFYLAINPAAFRFGVGITDYPNFRPGLASTSVFAFAILSATALQQ
jgi:hypothetical protein